MEDWTRKRRSPPPTPPHLGAKRMKRFNHGGEWRWSLDEGQVVAGGVDFAQDNQDGGAEEYVLVPESEEKDSDAAIFGEVGDGGDGTVVPDSLEAIESVELKGNGDVVAGSLVGSDDFTFDADAEVAIAESGKQDEEGLWQPSADLLAIDLSIGKRGRIFNFNPVAHQIENLSFLAGCSMMTIVITIFWWKEVKINWHGWSWT
ncbi:hypothetical protein EJB05_42574, partial [Eragrostis curvula]